MRAVPAVDLRQSQRVPATISISLVVESETFNVEHQASTIDGCVAKIEERTRIGSEADRDSDFRQPGRILDR